MIDECGDSQSKLSLVHIILLILWFVAPGPTQRSNSQVGTLGSGHLGGVGRDLEVSFRARDVQVLSWSSCCSDLFSIDQA